MRQPAAYVVTRATWAAALLATSFASAGEIHDAIRINDLKTVRALLDEQPKLVNSPDEDRVTPLHEAVRYGDAALVELLIARGADVHARCYNEFTPLHLTDDPDIARILLKHGANLKAQAASGTPLDDAIGDENAALIELYLAAGETLNFDQLVELGRTKEVAAALQDKPWLAKAPRKGLHTAAAAGNLELTKLLLDHGADPSLDYGFMNVLGVYSPLSSAVLGNHFEIARLLCQRGADVDVAGGKMYRSLFHFAVASRDVRFVRLLLEHGADVHEQNHYSAMTPLHVAANIGDVEKCKLLLQFRADVNAQTPDGAPPLFFAAVWRHEAVCDLLLRQGARLDIHTACLLGKRDELRRLLNDNPLVANAKNRRLLRTPLFWAAERGDSVLAAMLLEKGADPNARALRYSQAGNVVTGPETFGSARGEDKGETPLHVAAQRGDVDITILLLNSGAVIDFADQENRTPLYYAAGGGHVKLAQLLLARKAHPDPQPGEDSPLAASGGLEMTKLLLTFMPSQKSLDAALELATPEHPDVAHLLVKHGAVADLYTACALGLRERVAEVIAGDPAQINRAQEDYPRQRPLEIAAGAGQLAVVEWLLEREAEKERRGDWSALGVAAAKGQSAVVRLLIDRGADINLKDRMGQTPLHAASKHPALVKLLLERGADHSAADVYRKTPLHDAASAGDVESAAALLSAGAAVDAGDDFRATPLHAAAESGHAELARLLLARGADVNAKNRRGQTPLAYAERQSNPDFSFDRADRSAVASVLRQHGGK